MAAFVSATQLAQCLDLSRPYINKLENEIGIAFAVLHFTTPQNFTSSLGGIILTQGGHHTPFGHLEALVNYAVTVADNLLGCFGYWCWRSLSAP